MLVDTSLASGTVPAGRNGRPPLPAALCSASRQQRRCAQGGRWPRCPRVPTALPTLAALCADCPAGSRRLVLARVVRGHLLVSGPLLAMVALPFGRGVLRGLPSSCSPCFLRPLLSRLHPPTPLPPHTLPRLCCPHRSQWPPYPLSIPHPCSLLPGSLACRLFFTFVLGAYWSSNLAKVPHAAQPCQPETQSINLIN